MIIHSTAPDAFAAFYPYIEEDTTKFDSDETDEAMETNPFIVSSDIIAINTYKPKGGSGTFSMVLASSQNYKKLLHPGTWCMIYMSDHKLTTAEQSDENSGLKMVGIVRSVRAVETISEDGIRMLRYEISGDDFHSLLNCQVYINNTLKQTRDGLGEPVLDAIMILGHEFDTIMSPYQITKALIETILGTASLSAKAGIPLLVPQKVAIRLTGSSVEDGKFAELLELALQQNLIGSINVQPDHGSVFTLWSMLETYCHKILNEIYTDLMPQSVDGKIRLIPTFVHRAIPFSSADNKVDDSTLSIKDHVEPRSPDDIGEEAQYLYASKFIDESEIMALSSGKSDGERFNFFLCVSNLVLDRSLGEPAQLINLVAKTGGINDLGDVNSMARFGTRPYITHSNFMVESSDAVNINLIVRDIWKRAYLFENGTITLKGSPDHIPVGTNLVFKDRGQVAHIEAVGHNFSVRGDGSKSFRTTIQFVRLQNLDGSPIDSTEGSGEQRGNWDRGGSSTEIK